MGRRAEVQRICKNLYASHIFLIKLAAGTDTGKTGKTRKQGTEALFGAIFGISSGKLSIDYIIG